MHNPPSSLVTINLATDFNKKMSCKRFIHIDTPPKKDISQKQLDATVFAVVAKDGSHAPIKKRIASIVEFKLKELTNWLTWQSHGMDTAEFINFLHLEKKLFVSPDLQLAIYYYKEFNE